MFVPIENIPAEEFEQCYITIASLSDGSVRLKKLLKDCKNINGCWYVLISKKECAALHGYCSLDTTFVTKDDVRYVLPQKAFKVEV